MAETIQKTTQTTSHDGRVSQKTTEVEDPHYSDNHASDVASRVIWFVAGVLLVILGLRFLLSLLGANSANDFANFIYTVSNPFVEPFFNLFRYDSINNGASQFEVYTLLAMLVYTLIAAGLARLVTINRD